jgi:parallel beta-helix repeat protein
LSFEGQVGGPTPDPQALTISNAGGRLMEWKASTDAGWIILGAMEGKLSGGRAIQLLVLVEIQGLEVAEYQGTITIEAPGAEGSPAIIAVHLKIEPEPQHPAFFKVIDITVEPRTPIAGMTAAIKPTMENTGDTRGTDRVSLYVDGVFKDSRTLTLEPRGRGSVSFSMTFFTAKSYQVEIKTSDDSRSIVVVVKQPPHTVCSSECPFTRIQAAIDAARAGDTITVGAGTYNENIKIDKDLTLRGAGQEKTIIRAVKEDYPVIWITSGEEILVKLEGLKLTGATRGESAIGLGIWGKAKVEISSSTFSENEWGIVLGDSAQAIISNSTSFKNGDSGIWLGGSSQATISGSTFSGNEWGIVLKDASRVSINDSTISENLYDGINLSGSSQAKIERNKVINNKQYGVALFQKTCFETDEAFRGLIEGKKNTISGNSRANVCPSQLSFLMTDQGGRYP